MSTQQPGVPAAEVPSIQWFPGHMAKTRRLMSESLKLVDIVVELTDARIPASSRNPEIDKLVGQKPRVILLNKCDSADDGATRRWVDYYARKGVPAIATDCRSGKGLGAFLPLVKSALSAQLARRAEKGMSGQPIRMMIVGIPNVGKSSLINRLAGAKRAKVEDRPGVTRGRQWVSLAGGIDLLDMPGVLWPKFEDQSVGLNLAYTGAVKDEILDMETLGCHLMAYLGTNYPEALRTGYKLPSLPERQDGEEDVAWGYRLLEAAGKKRGFLISGGEVDTERMAKILLDEFRSAKLGRFTLELP